MFHIQEFNRNSNTHFLLQITETQRNNTKQICYGIIYGMGTKSMADNLKCSEDDARTHLESFHATYPGIR